MCTHSDFYLNGMRDPIQIIWRHSTPVTAINVITKLIWPQILLWVTLSYFSEIWATVKLTRTKPWHVYIRMIMTGAIRCRPASPPSVSGENWGFVSHKNSSACLASFVRSLHRKIPSTDRCLACNYGLTRVTTSQQQPSFALKDTASSLASSC